MSTPESTPASPSERYDPTESDQDTSGDMGVSSETEGPTGPGQHGSTGVRDVGPPDPDAPGTDVPPEQAAGGEEINPDPPIPPKSGYNSLDPRSDDHPYDKPPKV